MSWYGDGEWKDDPAGTRRNSDDIKSIFADLCCAVNERESTAGHAETSFTDVGIRPEAEDFGGLTTAPHLTTFVSEIVSKLDAVKSHYYNVDETQPLILPLEVTPSRWQSWDYLDYLRRYITTFRYIRGSRDIYGAPNAYFTQHNLDWHTNQPFGSRYAGMTVWYISGAPYLYTATSPEAFPDPYVHPYGWTPKTLSAELKVSILSFGGPELLGDVSISLAGVSATIPAQVLPGVGVYGQGTWDTELEISPLFELSSTTWPPEAPVYNIGGEIQMGDPAGWLSDHLYVKHYDYHLWTITATATYYFKYEIPDGFYDMNSTFTYPAITPYP